MSEPISNGEASAPRVEVSGDVPAAVRPPDLDAAMRRAEAAASAPLPEEMSVAQAADFLDVPPSQVRRLIKRGELPCRIEGKRRRIPSQALELQLAKISRRASEAADEMVRIAQEAGLYGLPAPKQQGHEK